MRKTPLYAQVLVAVFLGGAFGYFFGVHSAHYWATDAMGELGHAVIRLLKILAIPLVFFAIVDTIIKTEITGRAALKVVAVSLFNVSVAMLIGLFILNTFQPGKAWSGQLTPENAKPVTLEVNPQGAPKHDLHPLKVVAGLVPKSLVATFSENNTLSVILVALLFGYALRSLYKEGETERILHVENFVDIGFKATLKVISYVLHVIPIGVFCLVAVSVGKSGLAVFSSLWIFLVTILAGFFIHAFIYYPAIAWLVGRKSPRTYLGKGAEAVITAFSTNSSLATVPVTLRTLTEKMGVSDKAARLSACFATNLNNDGITLYEAMTALFLSQALGANLPIAGQVFIALVAILVSMGIAGIPEAGLIILPLVLGASGFTDVQISTAIALIVPIDWFIARLRSAVNVMSDMAVAIVIDKI